ncbi:MAG: FHA domain-containing protein [Microcoleus sp.]|uniref:FHA domain-containing protein n=1 Tax=Microcoleus sp. TaxID=44472 RepID=UPI003C75DADC
MIKLTLLHPLQSIPVRSWIFEDEQVVRIGRSTENHVVLFSAVVSRRHIELRRSGITWELINLGTNGTYLDGKPIAKVPIADGLIVHLARSGPKIQINVGPNQSSVHLGQTSVKPRDVKAIHASSRGTPLSTLPVADQKEVGTSREEEELTEAENTPKYSEEEY